MPGMPRLHWSRNLDGLTVPTLVIGSERDRLIPISQSRRIARTAPSVVGLVELPGRPLAGPDGAIEVSHADATERRCIGAGELPTFTSCLVNY